ncbi:MAG: hypothetical protein HC902_00460 [Calothrix sp. SM1_5_4]|nr:hypothetical protein [Calothrix sp. SM1_5_4]
MNSLTAFISPSEARKLPLHSPEREIAEHALRQLWHYLYDYAPKLLGIFSPDGKSLLEDWLECHYRERASIGWWSFPILLEHPEVQSHLDKELKTEILSAAVTRWLSSDRTEAQSICLMERNYGICILGLKSEGLADSKQILCMSHSMIEAKDAIFFSTSPGRELKSHTSWTEVWSPE